MIEVLGATGIVMLLTAVVGTSIMGVSDASKDAAIERQLQTVNSAYQAYLSSGGRPIYVANPSGTPIHGVLSSVMGITQTENGPIGPFMSS